MKIITSAILDGYTPRKDKSITIRFNTDEKTPAQISELHGLLDSYGYLYFKPEETLTIDEIKELDNLDTDLYDKPKTQSKRIRNVLFLNWQRDNDGYVEFKDYYKNKTEKIIQHFKNKLDD